MRHTTPFRIVILVAGLSALAGQAYGQIYALRDANGTLILSDKPLGADAQVFETARTVRVPASPMAPVVSDSRYEALIEGHASASRLRADLVRAVIHVESAFNPHARSPKGAVGLMQLMPFTARELGVDNPYDPDQNIRGGTMYLRRLLDRFGGNEELALAAYNAGPEAVVRYGHTVPPYRETRDYVQRVKGRTSLLASSTPPLEIYKTTEWVDGREVPRYSNATPGAREYELIERMARR